MKDSVLLESLSLPLDDPRWDSGGKICITSRVPLAAAERMGRRRIRPQAGDQVVDKNDDTSKG